MSHYHRCTSHAGNAPPPKSARELHNERLNFCIGLATQSCDVDAHLGAVLNKGQYLRAMGCDHVDHSYELVAINAPFPEHWLPQAVDGTAQNHVPVRPAR